MTHLWNLDCLEPVQRDGDPYPGQAGGIFSAPHYTQGLETVPHRYLDILYPWFTEKAVKGSRVNITQDPRPGCQERQVLSNYILKLHLAGDLRQIPGLGSLAVELHLPMPTLSQGREWVPLSDPLIPRGVAMRDGFPPRSSAPHLSGTMSPSTLNLRHLLPSRHGGRAPSTGQQSTR